MMAMSIGDVAIKAPGSEAPSTWLGVEEHREVGAPTRQISVVVRLDWILQNVGRRLMEIVDEDPI